MKKQTQTPNAMAQELAAMQLRLKEAEQTLAAIRNGEVDALVVDGANEKRVYTLQGADEPYRLMVERMHEGAVTILLEGTILYANHHFAQMVGQPLEKVIGTNVWHHLKPDGNDAETTPLEAAQNAEAAGKNGGKNSRGAAGIAGTNDLHKEFELRRAGGAVLPVQVSASLIEFQAVRCLCLVVTDLTQQRRHEEARRNEAHLRSVAEVLEQRVAERTSEVKHRLGQLQSLALELSRAEHRVRKRLAKVLHDGLQQLLVAASMRVNVLEGELHSDEARRDMEQLRQILTQSLELSRSLTAELSPPVLYSAGLPAALDWLACWMEEKHRLRVEVHADAAADPNDDDLRVFLFEAVREALLNVAKHAGVNRARVVLAAAGDGEIRLSVEDKGKGFDPAGVGMHGKISGGLGLLSIRERLTFLGGHMEVESCGGGHDAQRAGKRGTRISLLCPIPRRQETPAAPAALRPRAPAAVNTSGKIRLLVADDHKMVRKGLVALLSRGSDIEVVGEAADGVEALELARELHPDVVLMDVNMPLMDGIEATQRIFAELSGVRVIGLSMHTDLGVRMRQAGAVDYQTKDGPTEDLIAAIRGCCEKARMADMLAIEQR